MDGYGLHNAHTRRTDIGDLPRGVQRSTIWVESPADPIFVDGEDLLGDHIVADASDQLHPDGLELALGLLSFVGVQLITVLRTGVWV